MPGSVRVRLQAEAEGLDKVFIAPGAEWRGAGCSMCLGMNPDQLAPGERSASTSNRNFEGRQGKGGRTHLVSVPVAAATAVRGTLSSPADLRPRRSEPWTRSPPTPASACRCERSNVDTDQIIPAVYLKRVTRTGFEDGLFAAWRNDPDFVLNNPTYAAGSVLVAGPDFGTGSSREHAVWALQNYGFKAVISAALRRHLPRQLRQGRAASRRRSTRRSCSACGTASRSTRAPRSPSTWRRGPCVPARVRTRSRTPSTSTTTRAGACSRASTTSASRSAHDADITAYEADAAELEARHPARLSRLRTLRRHVAGTPNKQRPKTCGPW